MHADPVPGVAGPQATHSLRYWPRQGGRWWGKSRIRASGRRSRRLARAPTKRNRSGGDEDSTGGAVGSKAGPPQDKAGQARFSSGLLKIITPTARAARLMQSGRQLVSDTR